MDRPLAKPDPRRCLVLCSTKRFHQHSGDDKYFIKRVVEFASGDDSKAFHIGTRKGQRRVSILFDYNNPNHDDSEVLAFEAGKVPRYVHLRADMIERVHWQARRWIDDHKRDGCILPIRTELNPNPNFHPDIVKKSLPRPVDAVADPQFESLDAAETTDTKPSELQGQQREIPRLRHDVGGTEENAKERTT